MKKSTQNFLDKQSGGSGYYLPANTLYDAGSSDTDELNGVMNIDIIEDDTTFTVLKDSGGADLLADMNITGVALPSTITNFTHEKPFFQVTADKGVWLNRFVKE